MEIYKYIVKSSWNIRSTNSLIDFIYVAECKFGGVLNLFTKVWDNSGLGLIISEAGGIINRIDGNDIQYSVHEALIQENFPVIAGSPEIIESLKKGNAIIPLLEHIPLIFMMTPSNNITDKSVF